MQLEPGACRHIRSFVSRAGRITTAQQRHLRLTLPGLQIPYQTKTLDLEACFGRAAPKILEIGCGMGETTAAIALAHPENDYLGVEVHLPGLGNLCKLAAGHNISNLRLIAHDAVEVVRDMLAPATLASAHVYFPDPWPKKRHHKRRLLQAPFVSLLASRLQPGGYIHVATDWQDYAEQILAVLDAESALSNTSEKGFSPRPPNRPLTKFEQRGQKLGHGVWDLVFMRKEVGN